MGNKERDVLTEIGYLMNWAYSLRKTRMVGSPQSDYDKGYARGWSQARIDMGVKLDKKLKALEAMVADTPKKSSVTEV